MRLALLGLLLATLIGWEYAPAMRGGFVYEDAHTSNACPVAWSTRGRTLMQASWCAQMGQSMFAFHAVNLGLHLLVTGLVGALVWTVTQELMPALLGAAFFGVNAVNVEAVAYLSSRGELLAAVGVLGACLAALSRRWLFIAPLVFLGWWGKESAVVAVLLVPLSLWYQRGRVWAWVAAGAGVLLGLAILTRTTAWWGDAPSMSAWALLQTSAIVRVGLLAVLPFGQTVDYDYLRVPMAVQVFAAVSVVAGLIWVALQRSRLLLFGAAWTLLAAAPRLIVPTPRSVFPEHQFYLPLVGVALVVAGFLRGARA